MSIALDGVLLSIAEAHEKNKFWKDKEQNARRRWREYKKKFGDSRNAVRRSGYGPEVGRHETANSSKEVLKRRKLSSEGVFQMKERTLSVLQRKYTGGVKTLLAAKAEAAAAAAAEAEAEAAEVEGGEEKANGKGGGKRK